MSYASPKNADRQLAGFVAVIVLHIVMVYALVNGLARKIVEAVLPPLETRIIEEVKPPPPDRPPPPPKLATPPPPYVPPPEVRVQIAQTAPTITAVTNVKPLEPVPPPAAPIAAPARVSLWRGDSGRAHRRRHRANSPPPSRPARIVVTLPARLRIRETRDTG